jgi:quercetin dioxygenase-like cupin family protein
MPFATLAAQPARPLFAGVTGRYAHLDRLTIGEVELAAGAVVPVHQHPHDQLTYVVAGRAECTIGGETQVLEPGMCALIPGGTLHSFRPLTACRVLDAFTPARDDLR